MKIYSALYPNYAHLPLLGERVTGWETVYLPQHLEDKDSILLLHGGADISPSIYGQACSSHTWAEPVPSNRDLIEMNLVTAAMLKGIPIFGICRGAQLLCAMNGGTLVQHVTGHNGGKHIIATVNDDKIFASSAHHQMMNPGESEHELLAWSDQMRSDKYIIEKEQRIHMDVEPEVVYFPKMRALGVQGHPEWMQSDSAFVQYCLALIREKLLPCTD